MGGTTKGIITPKQIYGTETDLQNKISEGLNIDFKPKFWLVSMPYTQGPVGERTGSSYDDRDKENNNG